MLYFITGNKNKFEEIQRVFGSDLEMLEIELDEIQDIDPHKIIEHKLKEALKHHNGPFLVEDTSLYLDCLNGLPGPFIKWFQKTIGNEGIVEMTRLYGNNKAYSKVLIGYTENGGVEFFEAELHGKIVEPRGDKDFGWGPIFQPDGQEQTFGEMDRELKQSLSMRSLAAQKLKDYLDKQ